MILSLIFMTSAASNIYPDYVLMAITLRLHSPKHKQPSHNLSSHAEWHYVINHESESPRCIFFPRA